MRCLLFVVALLLVSCGVAGNAQERGGVVSHIKVLSNHCEDVSSPEDWRKTYIKDGMTDHDKALAIWKTVVRYRHQTNPPHEYLSPEKNVHDPLKTIHVAHRPREMYTIACGPKTVVKSFTVELAE